MQKQLLANFSIGKINDKFYAFYVRADMGGVCFGIASPEFHTSEDAHAFLVEKAKKDSTDAIKIICMEVERSFSFIADTLESDDDSST